jgi:hypothetical protein
MLAPHAKILLYMVSRLLVPSELTMNIYDNNDALTVLINESTIFIICNIVCGNAPGVTDRFASHNTAYLGFLESTCFVDSSPFEARSKLHIKIIILLQSATH